MLSLLPPQGANEPGRKGPVLDGCCIQEVGPASDQVGTGTFLKSGVTKEISNWKEELL